MMSIKPLPVLCAIAFAFSIVQSQDRLGPGDQEITISGFIDGSDQFHFSPGKIAWTHKHWKAPTEMTFAGSRWTNLDRAPQAWVNMKNLDLSKARVIKRTGRDTVALEKTNNGFILFFCDSPNGGDHYSITIAIPRM